MGENSELRPIPPNKLTKFAQMLRKAKDFGNNAQISFRGDPLIGGGDLLFGEAPEVLEQASYGDMPWSGRGQTFTLDPEVVDVAALPTFGAVGLGTAIGKKAPRALAKTLGKAVPEAPSNMGRRDFLKQGAAVATMAAAPAALVKSLGKSVPKAAVRSVSKLTKADAPLVIRNLLDSYIDRTVQVINKMGKSPNAESSYRGYLEDLESYYRKYGGKVYDEGDVKHMEAVIERLPDDLTPRELNFRMNAAMGVDEYGAMAPGTAKREGLEWKFEPGENIVNTQFPKELKEKMQLEAELALQKLDPLDVDAWIIMDRPPKGMEEYHKWLYPEDIYEHSSLFQSSPGGSMYPEDIIERRMNFQDKFPPGSMEPVNYDR